jgi:opacity protein-like surface antigen
MIKLLLALALASPAAFAEEIYVSGGFDFRPGAFDLAIGYRAQYLGLEASMIKEDARLLDRQRNQVKSLDIVGFVPITRQTTIFVKVGASHFRYDEASNSLVNGWNAGVGVDYRLASQWSLRSSLTYLRIFTDEDFHQAALLSVGLKYSF